MSQREAPRSLTTSDARAWQALQRSTLLRAQRALQENGKHAEFVPTSVVSKVLGVPYRLVMHRIDPVRLPEDDSPFEGQGDPMHDVHQRKTVVAPASYRSSDMIEVSAADLRTVDAWREHVQQRTGVAMTRQRAMRWLWNDAVMRAVAAVPASGKVGRGSDG